MLTGLAATGPASETRANAATYNQQALLPPHVADIPTARPSQKTVRLKDGAAGRADRRAGTPPPVETGCTGTCVTAASSVPAAAGKSTWSAIFAGKLDGSFASDPDRADRFARVLSRNHMTQAKLADLFGTTETVAASNRATPRKVPASAPAAGRFGGTPVDPGASADLALAYADPSPAGRNGALAALSAVTPQEDDALASDPEADGVLTPEEEARDADGTALSPDYVDTPEDTPLPGMRPEVEKRPKAEKPAKADEAPREVAKPSRERARERKLAYARPDNPAEERGGNLGDSLKNLFSRPKAGRGVAVYDISAAKVYMPDGSVLEAHSGIGHMADNPKYAHVKMKGPTPPHTYNLRMREKRFHGVEAIRMLPVDGKNKHGRDGFLTHSYLLRGGRAESHGCVAFKHYDKFLNAFKQGKVKQLVVVPGGGKAIARNVRKGHDA